MRSFRREERGISPIVATILLIATTVIAAGVIAAYVSGMYVGGTTVIAGTADGTVYDYDNAAAVDNYQNANVSITVTLTSGRLRNIGDPNYATVVDLTAPKSGFHASLSFASTACTDNWGGIVEGHTTVTPWTDPYSSEDVDITVRIPTDSTGRLVSGGTITILMKPFNADAHDNADNRMNATPVLWEDADTINVIITGRDSLSLTGYDGAYLGASRWTA